MRRIPGPASNSSTSQQVLTCSSWAQPTLIPSLPFHRPGPRPQVEYEPDVMLIQEAPAHRTDHRVSLPSVCIVARHCQSGIGVDTCIAASALPLSWPHRQGSSLPRSHGLFAWWYLVHPMSRPQLRTKCS